MSKKTKGKKKKKDNRKDNRVPKEPEKSTIDKALDSIRSTSDKALDSIRSQVTLENITMLGEMLTNFAMSKMYEPQQQSMSTTSNMLDILGASDMPTYEILDSLPGANAAKNILLNKVTGIPDLLNDISGATAIAEQNKHLGRMLTQRAILSIYVAKNYLASQNITISPSNILPNLIRLVDSLDFISHSQPTVFDINYSDLSDLDLGDLGLSDLDLGDLDMSDLELSDSGLSDSGLSDSGLSDSGLSDLDDDSNEAEITEKFLSFKDKHQKTIERLENEDENKNTTSKGPG